MKVNQYISTIANKVYDVAINVESKLNSMIDQYAQQFSFAGINSNFKIKNSYNSIDDVTNQNYHAFGKKGGTLHKSSGNLTGKHPGTGRNITVNLNKKPKGTSAKQYLMNVLNINEKQARKMMKSYN